MNKRDIIVIGASAGGIEPLTSLISKFLSYLIASIFIVVHFTPQRESLNKVLQTKTKLNVNIAEDGQEIKKGNIYIAQNDKHMIFSNN